MEISNYKPVKGVVRAFFTLKLPKIKLEFNDCSWAEKDGNRWFSFPSKKYEKDGATKYMPYARFETKEIKESFDGAFFLVLEKFLLANPQFDEKITSKETQSHLPF
jgi:hypothetical protein